VEAFTGSEQLDNPEASRRRVEVLREIAELPIDDEVRKLAEEFVSKGGIPSAAEADALHIAVAAVHHIDYLLTRNFRHIDNAAMKPVIRSICAIAGYTRPEICAPMELLEEDDEDVRR
jgi:predicted nucleic acid-binding protein